MTSKFGGTTYSVPFSSTLESHGMKGMELVNFNTQHFRHHYLMTLKISYVAYNKKTLGEYIVR